MRTSGLRGAALRWCGWACCAGAGALVLALGTTGCPQPGPGETDAGPKGPGATQDYVVNSMTMPTPAAPVGLDVDGDGTVDNALGTLLSFIPTLAPDFDVQTTIDGNLMMGSLVLLWRVSGVHDFATDSEVSVETWAGEPSTTNLLTYSGGGTFAIAASAPAAEAVPAGIGGGACATSGAAGALETCTGTIPFSLPLAMVDTMNISLGFTLVSARVECQGITAQALALCTMGGAITQDEIDNRVIPDLAAALNTLIPARATLDAGGMMVPCLSDNMTIGDHASATCAAIDPLSICSASSGVDMGICVDGTSGLVGFALDASVDADGNGILTATELSGLLSAFLVPDLDLEPAGAPDGTDDAISLGFDFAAAAATITGP